MYDDEPVNPREPLFVAFRGKRYSGKDFIAQRLSRMLWGVSATLSFGDLLKEDYAQNRNIDLNELYLARTKELHREDLVAYAKLAFQTKGAVFCHRHLERSFMQDRAIIIVPDVRFFHELKHLEKYGCLTIEISASEDVRTERGWKYNPRIDDTPGESELDSYTKWNYTLRNEPGSETSNDILLRNIAREALYRWAYTNI